MTNSVKYSFLELCFSNWKWVRKLHRGYWVKGSCDWVKFNKKELDEVTISLMKNMKYIIEDYTDRRSLWQTLMKH